MLKLSLSQEPYWLELGLDVRVKVKPCNSAIFYQARAFMNHKLQEIGENYRQQKEVGGDLTDLPDLKNEQIREALAEQFLTLGLARHGIIEWQGILDHDSDQAAPVNTEKIDELFLNYWLIAESFRQQYTGMHEILAAEKNDSGSAVSGISATGQNTAKTARNKTTTAPTAKKTVTASPAPISNTS